MSETESNDAWLGLLKWSLNYVDGTVPSSESSGFKEMSAEKRAFLEEVMKNGIIDEGQRMKTILSSLDDYVNYHDEETPEDELIGGISILDRVNSIREKIESVY